MKSFGSRPWLTSVCSWQFSFPVWISPPPLIAVDEPEIGLHPSMLSIVAEFAVEASRHSQVIISTHSEAFLNAFGETRPTTTVVRWNQGETSLTKLDDNQLAEWLKSYSLGALFASGELENVQ